MSIDKFNLENSCQELCEEIQKEYPHLTLVFIVYDKDDIKSPIIRKQDEIRKHPAGHALLFELNNKTPTPQNAIEFAGIACGKKNKILGLGAKEKFIAGLLINADNFEFLENAKIEIWAETWKILKLLKDIQSKNETLYRLQNEVFLPKATELQNAKNNMLGDAFTAILMELMGRRNMRQHIAKHRCIAGFNKTLNVEPECYPYPAILDTTNMVFEDISKIGTGKNNPVKTTIMMVNEIALSCDDVIIKQWQAFIEAAQDMVWSGIDIRNILGAAIYTSENTYNRSNAYLVAEILGMEAAPMTAYEGYNPFADIEAQERQHKKLCEEKFQKLMSESALNEDAHGFFKEAYKQCFELLKNDPTGWDAPALAAAALAYKKAQEEPQENTKNEDEESLSPLEHASQTYRKITQSFEWQQVQNLQRALIQHERQGNTSSTQTIVELIRQDKENREAAIAIKDLVNLFENDEDFQKDISLKNITSFVRDRKKIRGF